MLLERLSSDARVDSVLLVARYESYLNGPEAKVFEEGLRASISQLRQAGKRVLLLDPVPTYRYPIPAALAQLWRRGEALESHGQTRLQYETRQAAALALVARLVASGEAERVSVESLFCAGERCDVVDGGSSLYFDDNHLSMHGGDRVARSVVQLLNTPAKPKAAD